MTTAQKTGALTQTVKDDIVDCARTVVKLEDRFVDLAFEMGPIEGLSAAEIKAYIRYIADWRLKQLGLPQVYGVKEHPLPWLTAMLNGVEHANFFETRATEYAKAATRTDSTGLSTAVILSSESAPVDPPTEMPPQRSVRAKRHRPRS